MINLIQVHRIILSEWQSVKLEGEGQLPRPVGFSFKKNLRLPTGVFLLFTASGQLLQPGQTLVPGAL